MPQDPQQKTELSLDEFEEQARQRFGVPKGLWESLKGQESGGDVNATSPTGVRGRFQVTQKTAAAYGLNRDDPFHQAVAAAKNLREGYDKYSHLKDDNERWLAAAGYYYGGPDAVGRDGALSTTSKDNLSNPSVYVTKIAQGWKAYNDSQSAPQKPASTPTQQMRFDLRTPGQTNQNRRATPGGPNDPFNESLADQNRRGREQRQTERQRVLMELVSS